MEGGIVPSRRMKSWGVRVVVYWMVSEWRNERTERGEKGVDDVAD